VQYGGPGHHHQLQVPQVSVSRERRYGSCSGLQHSQHRSAVDTDDIACSGSALRMDGQTKENEAEYIAKLNETVTLEDSRSTSAVSSLNVVPFGNPVAGDVLNRGGSNVQRPKNSLSNAAISKCGASKIAADSKRRENRRSTSGIPSTNGSSGSHNLLRTSRLSMASSLTNISAQSTKSKATASVSDNIPRNIPKPPGMFLT